jgi:hypothetical protein
MGLHKQCKSSKKRLDILQVWPPLTLTKFRLLGCIEMPEDYFKERLRAQEDEIASLRVMFESARVRGNKKLMGISRKRLEMALSLREMYERMLKREGVNDQLA